MLKRYMTFFKTTFCILFSIFSSSIINAQIGINTQNALGVFHVDGKGDNTTTTATDQAENDFIVTANGNVGIGTNTPSYKLSVNGGMDITGVKDVLSSDTNYQPQILMRNSTTGEVVTLASAGATIYPINYITYNITSGDGDYLYSYNTRISANDYIVAIVGFSFSAANGGNIGLNYNGGEATFTPATVQSYVSGSTWFLKADYIGAGTVNNANGKWTIKCLVINRLLGKNLGVITQSLNGLGTGEATDSPSGL